MDHLLPEILGMTLSLLPKKDLKKARRVSKAWEKTAVPYLFDQIFLSPNVADLETAEVGDRSHWILCQDFDLIYRLLQRNGQEPI